MDLSMVSYRQIFFIPTFLIQEMKFQQRAGEICIAEMQLESIPY